MNEILFFNPNSFNIYSIPVVLYYSDKKSKTDPYLKKNSKNEIFGSFWIEFKSESRFVPKLKFIFQVFAIVTNFMSPSGVTKWTKVVIDFTTLRLISK